MYRNAIKTKYDNLKITDISSIPYSYVPDKKILLKVKRLTLN